MKLAKFVVIILAGVVAGVLGPRFMALLDPTYFDRSYEDMQSSLKLWVGMTWCAQWVMMLTPMVLRKEMSK